jgi:hypothetical protein
MEQIWAMYMEFVDELSRLVMFSASPDRYNSRVMSLREQIMRTNSTGYGIEKRNMLESLGFMADYIRASSA